MWGRIGAVAVILILLIPSMTGTASIGAASPGHWLSGSRQGERVALAHPLGSPSGITTGVEQNSSSTSVSSLSCTMTGVSAGSGVFIFMGWQNSSVTPSSVSDGTNTYIELEYQVVTGGTSSAVAVYMSQNGSDHSANVAAGTYTVTAHLSSSSPDFSLFCLELKGYGAFGRIYADSYGKSPGQNTGSSNLQSFDPFRTSPDGMLLLPVVQSGATFNAASPGTRLTALTGGAGTSLAVSYGLIGSTLTFQSPVGISWSHSENYAAPIFEVDAVAPIVSQAAAAVTPSLLGSQYIFQPDFLYEPLGAHVSNASQVIEQVSTGMTILVAVHTLPGFSGSSGYVTVNISDSQSNTYHKIARGQSGNSFSTSSDVEDMFGTNATQGTIVIKVVVTQPAASSPFNLWFAVVGSTGRLKWGTPENAGGKTGASGGEVNVTNATLPAGHWIVLSGGGIVSASASAGITFTPVGNGAALQNTPTQDTNNLPSFYQENNSETTSSDRVGATWSPSSGSDSWAIVAMPFGGLNVVVIPPSLSCNQSAIGSGPVTPSLSDPIVLETINAATLQRNAYIETIKTEQCMTTFWVSGTPEIYYANVTGMAVLTSDLARDSGSQATLTANQTWINSSAKCQAFYCFPNETICDSLTVVGQLPRSLLLNRACAVSGIEYAGPLPLGRTSQYINVTVTRLDSFLVQPAAFWYNPNSGEKATAMNLSILTAKEFNMSFGFVGANVVNNQTSLTAYLTLAAPYPPGTWDQSQTQVRYYSNASHPILNFDQTLTDVVVSWRLIQVIQNITIALFGSPAGTFGNGNQTVPSNINLALLNITSLPSGLFQATASWTNSYASTFVGSITCTGPWTSLAIDTNASINSAPVLSVPTQSSVFILSGQVNASNGTTITVSVTYLAGSAYTATGPIGFLNGVGFSWVDILLLVAVSLAIATYLTRRRKGEAGQALMAATGIVMIGLVGSVWLAGV